MIQFESLRHKIGLFLNELLLNAVIVQGNLYMFAVRLKIEEVTHRIY